MSADPHPDAWAGRFTWEDGTRPGLAAGFYIDGIGPLPPGAIGSLVESISLAPSMWACYGKALRLGRFDFGGTIGDRAVLIWEKYIQVYDPAAAPPWNVQGAPVGQYGAILAALGL